MEINTEPSVLGFSSGRGRSASFSPGMLEMLDLIHLGCTTKARASQNPRIIPSQAAPTSKTALLLKTRTNCHQRSCMVIPPFWRSGYYQKKGRCQKGDIHDTTGLSKPSSAGKPSIGRRMTRLSTKKQPWQMALSQRIPECKHLSGVQAQAFNHSFPRLESFNRF